MQIGDGDGHPVRGPAQHQHPRLDGVPDGGVADVDAAPQPDFLRVEVRGEGQPRAPALRLVALERLGVVARLGRGA